MQQTIISVIVQHKSLWVIIIKNGKTLFYSDAKLQSITTETVKNYINTMPARMQALIEAKEEKQNITFLLLCENKHILVDNKM